MSKYYSVLEQHKGDSWFYHRDWTFNTREESESWADKFSKRYDNRPTRIYEHDEPLPPTMGFGLQYWENDIFGYPGGQIIWVKGKLVDYTMWKKVENELPPIDKEVVVLAYNIDKEHYKVLFAHRVNPKGDGVGYDEGGWNLPNVAWWLDLELPI